MTTSSLYTTIACLGPIGTMRGSGTIATLCTIPLVIALHALTNELYIHILIISIFIFVGRAVIYKACSALNDHEDPSYIVLDELIGCFVTFCALSLTIKSVIIGVILFRFFDITKIAGISYLEKYPHGWGIVLDDVAAGIISTILLRILL